MTRCPICHGFIQDGLLHICAPQRNPARTVDGEDLDPDEDLRRSMDAPKGEWRLSKADCLLLLRAGIAIEGPFEW